MPAGNVFEIALGLGFTFFLAMLCSAIVEFISNLVRKRAKYLLRGLRDMLDTPETAESAAPADRWTAVRQDVTGEQRLYESALAATPEVAESEEQPWAIRLLGHPLIRSGDALGWLSKVLGLAITAAAASLGAPFWFDVLNRIGSLRNVATS